MKATDTDNVKVTINIASVDSAGETIPAAIRYDAIEYVCGVFADRFGGASSFEGFGAWRSDAGVIVRERNTFVYSYAAANDVVLEVLQGIARIVARRLNQESVLLTIEPVAAVHFVSQDSPAPRGTGYDAAAEVQARVSACYGPDTDDDTRVCVCDCSRCDNDTAARCDSFGAHVQS